MELVVISIIGGLVSLIISIFVICNKKKEQKQHGNEYKRKEIHRNIVRMISEGFLSLRWDTWDDSVHEVPGQLERMERAAKSCNMKLANANVENGVFDVIGDSNVRYRVSSEGCTCPDFHARRLPCKHMYFAAMRAGEIDGQKER